MRDQNILSCDKMQNKLFELDFYISGLMNHFAISKQF